MDLLINLIKDLSLIDVLDILLVSYGAYRVLLFIEGTRTFNLLKGLGILLIFLVVTRYLNFNTLSWILSNALPTGFLALVVIFQPELRRALEDIGRGSFMADQLADSESIPDMVDEVSKTIEACSKKRIGALIVIEQEIGLKDFIANGIPIQGKITSEILNTIFMPFTPLHDGAVIIKGSNIAAASCFLPVTNNTAEITKGMGSRHRAAIGITEITDALVFIVSEETGTISKAKGGRLMKNLPMERVKKLLTAAFNRANKTRRIFSQE